MHFLDVLEDRKCRDGLGTGKQNRREHFDAAAAGAQQLVGGINKKDQGGKFSLKIEKQNFAARPADHGN